MLNFIVDNHCFPLSFGYSLDLIPGVVKQKPLIGFVFILVPEILTASEESSCYIHIRYVVSSLLYTFLDAGDAQLRSIQVDEDNGD